MNELELGLSPKEFSPNVREASAMPILAAKSVESLRSNNNEGSEELVKKSVVSTTAPAAPAPETATVETSRDITTAEAIPAMLPATASTSASTATPPTLAPAPSPASAALSTPELREAARGDALAALTGGEPQSPAQAHVVHNHYYNHNQTTSPAIPASQDSAYPNFPDSKPAFTSTVRDVEKAWDPDAFDEYLEKKASKQKSGPSKFNMIWTTLRSRDSEVGGIHLIWVIAIALGLLALLLTATILAMTLTRSGDHTIVQSAWLNLTGFPPIPTGISTIAAPNLQSSRNQCVEPSTMWSCSAMKDVSSNGSNQPNFRFLISSGNGTAKDPSRKIFLLRILLHRAKKSSHFWGGRLTTPQHLNPILPNGSNISATTSKLYTKRISTNSTTASKIPPADTLSNDIAAPASLLPTSPYPSAQLIRLYNRGQQDEYYGFYTYYDKSIFLSGLTLNGTTISDSNEATVDNYGGAWQSNASVRCTFSQTRFLVKLYTNPGFGASLLGKSGSGAGVNLQNSTFSLGSSSATDFTQPGSWPYPTTITIDRHGGDAAKKGVYCYGMQEGKIVKESKVLIDELRSVGGTIVNQASSSSFNKTLGGIDGGSGGCGCNWQNWQ
ncbi:hypothetical protein LTR66_017836 [Elasticomyces elasticus]|nr:hypothetical protein LTR66_017836 [Elasticomyces elasticus]